MEISSTGIKKTDLTDYFVFWTNKLREKYGQSFVIKKDGFIDNLATASSLTNMAIEDVIMELVKNLDARTAEGQWQDALYALIGLERVFASYTTVQRTLLGDAGTVCEVGSVRFKNMATEDIFELNTAVTIGEDGTAKGSFTAIELGAIELDSVADLALVDSPDGVKGIKYSVDDTTSVGNDYQDDSTFRLRWLANQSSGTSRTAGGIVVDLLPLVNDNIADLKVRQNRAIKTYDDLELHTMEIILKTAESDDTIAKTILDNLPDGLGLYGKTTLTLQDDSGEDVPISFSRAEELPVYFDIEVVLESEYLLTSISTKVKTAITSNFSTTLGEKVVANDYYQYINSIDGIDYVQSLKIRTADGNGVDVLTIDYNQYTTVVADNITIKEAE